MAARASKSAMMQRKLPLFGVSAALMLALPTASLALVGVGGNDRDIGIGAFEIFTPASVDPELAARVAQKAREKGLRFTPAGANPVLRERTVTVAVRIDDESAKAISVRNAIESAPGAGQSIAALQPSKFNLGTARGYQSFARPVPVQLPASVRGDLSMPDLAQYEPSRPATDGKPSRLQPRIELEDKAIAGRSLNTLDASEASVDVGGSFRLSPNLDVTAGVRYSQERDRLAPLTDAVQDSQAVYVGTQIRF